MLAHGFACDQKVRDDMRSHPEAPAVTEAAYD
jgi:hypothetical protein